MWFFKKKNKIPIAFAENYLPVQDGYEIFYHQFGNPNGEPVLCFHGGPGDRSRPEYTRVFNLSKYRIIYFDQRGCGKSKFKELLYKNTMQETTKDALRVLSALNIKDKVIVYGGSYGSTLALLFAEQYPEYVKKLWVNGIFLARRHDDQDWMEKDVRRFYPEFIEEMEKVSKGKPLDKYFAELLLSKNKDKERIALKYYWSLINLIGNLNPKFKLPNERDYDKEIKMFKIVMQYTVNDYFLKENQILKNAKRIAHIPTLIIHNRLDMVCTVDQAFELHKALPKSKLYIVPDYGHISSMIIEKIKKLYE